MSRVFDMVVIVDWSSAGAPSPARDAPNAVWAGVAGEAPRYFRTRAAAIDWLAGYLAAQAAAGRRVLAGFDFPFGYPAGFARAVTGVPEALALWAWFAERVADGADNRNNRFDVAAALNAGLGDPGPFWGNGLARDIAHLPRRKPGFGPGVRFCERRLVERAPYAAGAKSCWQLSGAGSVGGQVLTGLPALYRLRAHLGGAAAVWPFDSGLALPAAPVVLAEVYPSLLAAAIAAARRASETLDAAQVRVTAAAFAALDAAGGLAPCFAPDPPAEARGAVAREEGFILAADRQEALRAAAAPPAGEGALPEGVDWVPVDAALARLRDGVEPVAGIETVPLGAAGGRILAAPVQAKRANPPAANAAVDGYGLAHAGLGEAPPCTLALMPGRAAAGAPFPGRVPPGSAVRILTGALLPEGVDTVVLDEAVRREGASIRLARAPKPGANTRAAGEDVAAGAEILPAGRRLRPQDLALAAAVGLGALPVRRRLKVAVLSTGDELAPAGADAPPHRTFDANRPMLIELLRRWEMEPCDLGQAADRAETVAAALDACAAAADAILTSGGASAGDEDHVAAALKARGALAVWRIAVKPGRPMAVGTWGGKPVFGLPGNPVAALVCTLVFARPALFRLAGAPWTAPRGLELPAAFEKRKRGGRREYLRARLDGDGRVEVFASEGSGRISGLVWADGLVELEDGPRTVRPGDPVRYLPFSEFGL